MRKAPVPDPLRDADLQDRALLLGDTLVLADLHLGQGATAGLDLPVGDGSRTVDRLATLLADVDPATVVLAGDVLHSFSALPTDVQEALDTIGAAGETHDVRVVVLEGNHDTRLAEAWPGTVAATHRIGDTVVCHGHEQPTETAERYVIGHDHPILDVAGRRRPCYLAGESAVEGSDVVVLPPFSRLLRGVVVNDMAGGEFMSPLIGDADGLAPVVWDQAAGEALPFPPLGTLREKL